MKFYPTEIPDVVLIEPTIFSDERGFFMEVRHGEKFARAGIKSNFVQDNFSRSYHNILRGLHYQIKQPQGKLVRVAAGEIFDVAVDLRKNSPTFGKYVTAILSGANNHQLWIPAGFAHGFYVLSDYADVIYSCDNFFAQPHERTIIWNDGDLKINWPLPNNRLPQVSAKDAAGMKFKDAEYFL